MQTEVQRSIGYSVGKWEKTEGRLRRHLNAFSFNPAILSTVLCPLLVKQMDVVLAFQQVPCSQQCHLDSVLYRAATVVFLTLSVPQLLWPNVLSQHPHWALQGLPT